MSTCRTSLGDRRKHQDFSDYHSFTRHSANDRNLPRCSTGVEALPLVFIFLFAADKSLVNFNFASQWQDTTFHSRSPAMAHIPACVIVGAGIFTEDYPVN